MNTKRETTKMHVSVSTDTYKYLVASAEKDNRPIARQLEYIVTKYQEATDERPNT